MTGRVVMVFIEATRTVQDLGTQTQLLTVLLHLGHKEKTLVTVEGRIICTTAVFCKNVLFSQSIIELCSPKCVCKLHDTYVDCNLHDTHTHNAHTHENISFYHTTHYT